MMLTALAASLAPCLLTGCDDDLTGEAETRASRVICFSTAAIDEATTRAASVADSVWSGTAYDPVTHDSLPIFGQILPWDAPESGVSTRGELITASTLKSFSVSAIQTRTETKETTTLFTDEKNTRPSSDNSTPSENSTWVYDSGNIYYWPGDDFTLDFYAVAPAGAVTSDNYANANTRNEFTYTVPSSPAEQQDLMVDSVAQVAGNNNAAVGLAFKHICTSIQFVVSNIPSDASITAVRLKGIKNSGTYSYASNSWTLGSATNDFKLSNSQGLTIDDDSYIASDDNCFIMLPQDFETGSEAMVEVVISEPDKDDATKKNTKTYSAKLAGSSWPMGQKVRYSIDIDAEYTFQLTGLSTTVDAHYVIVKAAIGSNNFLDGKDWSISVDNDATILYEEEANEFIKEGYWTDRYLDSDSKDTGSARGTSEIKGTDTEQNGKGVYILIPENTESESRDITVTININKKLFTTYKINQLTAIDGWEQIDEGEKAEFGFSWNRKANLIYPYSYEPGTYNIFTGNYKESTKEKDYKDYCQSVIDDNEAGAYATVQNYLAGLRVRRYYIAIDYSTLGTSLDCADRNDGLSNTKTLKAEAGTTTSTSFEDILLSIMKTENNTSENFNPHAFRYPNDGDGDDRPADPSGDNTITSAAVGVCLKKNKYNLKKNSNTIDGVTMSGYSPTLATEDVVWYMPAVDEFNSVPSDVKDAITPLECWSSTISTEDATVAYLGNGDTASRTSSHKIRAKRKQQQQ
jgi:hypothetical protein